MDNRPFKTLIEFLKRIPSIKEETLSYGDTNGIWWVQFSVDITHILSWHTIQELGHVINHLSLEEPLPTVFYPVSSPPYLNGGPEEYLSWVIETKDNTFKPNTLMQWLEGRLPRPVEDLEKWMIV